MDVKGNEAREARAFAEEVSERTGSLHEQARNLAVEVFPPSLLIPQSS